MGGFETADVTTAKPGPSFYKSSIAKSSAVGFEKDEKLEAFPVIHYINIGIAALKDEIHDGERGVSCKKVSAYLGYRLITYTGIPLALNLLSTVISAVICLLLLPAACCDCSAFQWSVNRLEGSLGYTAQCFFDLTCDFRQLTGICCCPPDSAYLEI